VRHLRDCDRDVLLPRLERTLAEEFPVVAPATDGHFASGEGWADADAASSIAAWTSLRARMVRLLEAAGPEQWQRPIVHPARGPLTLADQVRTWTNHDLSHRRQWRLALGELA
jgi:hypothetical protein